MKTTAISLLLILLVSFSASAALVITYHGQEGSGISANTIVGSGIIEFPDGLSFIGLDDISNFSFTNVFTIRNASGDPVANYSWSFGLADLDVFNSTLVGDTVSTFHLETTFVAEAFGATGVKPANFIVDSFPAARTEALDGAFSFTVTEGTVSVVPEPSSIFLLGTGLLWAAFRGRRRR